jgi:hypothetical protein
MATRPVRRFAILSIVLVLCGGMLYLVTYASVYATELGDNETQSCMDRPVPDGVPPEGLTNAFHTEWPLGSSCVYGDVVVPEPDWTPTYIALASGVMVATGLGLGIVGGHRRDKRYHDL